MRDFGDCQEIRRDEEISKSEKRCRFVLLNPGRNPVKVIKVDGCAITDGKRCDWLFVPQRKAAEVYVELKGSDISHALEQLEETIRKLSPKRNDAGRHAFVVCRNFAPSFSDRVRRQASRFLKLYNAVLVVRGPEVRHGV